jgi:hypothetical protein
MSFLWWNDLQYLLKRDSKGNSVSGFSKQETAKWVGRLLHIKEIEKLAHWDFRLRHLLAWSTNPGSSEDYLWVIDVEWFRPVQIENVQFEHQKLVGALLELDPSLESAIKEWYDSVSEWHRSIYRDIVDVIKADIWIPKGMNLYK